MTSSRLAEIKALADAATEGPWGFLRYHVCSVAKRDGEYSTYRDSRAPTPVLAGKCHLCEEYPLVKMFDDAGGQKHIHALPPYDDSEGWRDITSAATFQEITGNYDYEAGGVNSTEADARFIAASRTAVPELVAEVERLRDQFSVLVEEYRDQLSENSHMREEVARLTALLARPRCRWLTGALQCLLDEGHEGECRMSKTPDPGLVNHEHMPIEWMV